MARRTRIIYASQSVQAEGRILYRVQTLGSTTTFDTADIFEMGQLNLVDIVESAPAVAVTLETKDYGSIYTLATLAKIPTQNLNHNIRQTDGITFSTVSGVDYGTGDLSTVSGLPAGSGTGIANIVIKDTDGNVLRYMHGVNVVDFARECGVSKGVDLISPIQAECSLGTANDNVEFTQALKDVFINNITVTYPGTEGADATENYTGETEKKQWFLNSARFISWEEWRVGPGTDHIAAAALGAKNDLQLSLATPSIVATLEDTSIAFLKHDLAGRPAVLFSFAKGGGLDFAESKAIPVFDKDGCTPTSVLEYFLYDSSDNTLEYYTNGVSSPLSDALPAGRGAYATGDNVTVIYAANAFAAELGEVGRPVGADANYVLAKYFAPVGTDDVEDVGGIRKGQIEAYLVDPDLLFKQALTGATVGATSIAFAGNTVSSQVDLTNFVGLKLRVVAGPGKNGPAREITAAANSITGAFNHGSLTLGGAAWSTLRLKESSSQVSTTSGVFVDNLCGVDADYVGSTVTVVAATVSYTRTIAAVDTSTNLISFTPVTPAAVDNLSSVLVSVTPTTASTVLVGDYELALRLQAVTITCPLTREVLSELGHLDPYARTVTLPIKFTVAVEATASDLEQFATFAGKGSKFKSGTLTDLDVVDLLSKTNLCLVAMIYQQSDKEAGGTGLDRHVNLPDMFGDEYFVDGIRNIYTATDGSLTEYPLKTVIAQQIHITDEGFTVSTSSAGKSNYSFKANNQLSFLRGYVSVSLASEDIQSQG